MRYVWFLSVVPLLLFSFLWSFLETPLPHSGYLIGKYLGAKIPYIIVSVPVLYFCLKKKQEHGEEYKFPKWFIVVVVVCSIIGGIQKYITCKNEKEMEQMFARSISKQQKNGVEANYVYDEKDAKAIDECNEKFPLRLNDNMVIQKCEAEGYSLVYIVRCNGMVHSDFSDQYVEKIRGKMIEKIRNEEIPLKGSLLDIMKEKGCDVYFRYFDENDDLIMEIFVCRAYEI